MDQLRQLFGLRLEENVPLKNITTVGIGGSAKYFLTVLTIAELKETLTFCKNNNIKYYLIGSGSNILVSDSGVDFLIIKNQITGISSDQKTLSVFAGTLLQELVDFTVDQGLSGA